MNGKELLKPLVRRLRSGVRRAARLSYPTARAWYQRDLARQARKSTHAPVLVYQMGKVGSTSIALSVRQSLPGRAVYHFHTLVPERLDAIETRSRSYVGTHREGKLYHVWQSQYLLQSGVLEDATSKPLVVTLTRDPVARNVSTFFEHIESKPLDDGRWHVISTEYGFELDVRRGDYDRLAELFLEKCRHASPVEFFDREIQRVFGLDVFEQEFDRERGYCVYETAHIRILVVRLGDLNRCHAEAFNDLTPGSHFELAKANVGGDKGYADLYEDFRHNLRLPAEYLDRMYGSRYAQHFYSAEEIEEQRSKWT